ncbi:MAG: disulfide bond formation protein B [Planctomycetes bacterium]|nr:disulfide bond formation protein B [Planctomycetota bacterium]
MSMAETTLQRGELRPSVWVCLTLVVSLGALAGSLYLSLGMNLRACPLCFYQRTFVMSLVAVLSIGLAIRANGLGFVALPLATGGLGVACFHVFLELSGKLECPSGLFELGSAPQQSLAVFAVVFGLLLIDGLRSASRHPFVLFGGLLLGALLAAASCTSNPPMPAPPIAPYDKLIPDTCRPPFRAAQL